MECVIISDFFDYFANLSTLINSFLLINKYACTLRTIEVDKGFK